MTVRPAESNVTSTKSLQGVIETILFVGEHYEGGVRISDSNRILVYLPKVERWAEGQHVTVDFPPDRLTIWKK